MAETSTCPRCGYDQQGVIDSWKTECPLTGICSECGLAFQWRDLLDPRFMSRPGLYEHATRHRALHFLYTLWKSLRPWTFWQWIRMEDKIVLRKLIHFGGLMQIVVLITAVLVAMVSLFIAVGAPFNIINIRTSLELFGYVASLGQYDSGRWGGNWQLVPFPLLVPVVLFTAPGLMLVFGQSMRLARVSRQNLIRILIYSSIVVPLTVGMMGISRYMTYEYWSDLSFVTGLDDDFAWAAIPAMIGLCFQTISIWCAVKLYLRLEHAWAIALSIGGISALVLAIGYVLTLWWMTWMWAN